MASQTPSQVPVAQEQNTDPSAQVLRQFRVVFNAVRAHFQQVERQAGVGGALVWALHEIQCRPGLGVNELARAMDIHQSTASNLVRQLNKRGLIRSEKASTDRRNVQLYAEAEGLALLQRVPGPYEGVLPQALRRLAPETLQQLQADLGILIGVLQADESAAQTPLAEL